MKIVLVDVSQTVLHIVSSLLRARGHDVQPLVDGAAALNFVETHPDCDVLITSIELPSLSGFELCWDARLLAVERRRPLYIIVMSSNYDDARLGEALDCGADDFMSKPPRANALHARLRAAERFLRNETELIRLASIDPLTELLNRRAFFVCGTEAIARAQAGGSLAAVMLDIDHFKQINDRHGHDVGDRVIRAVARELANVGLPAGRLGGEEFALLAEGTAADQAMRIAQSLRINCAGHGFGSAAGLFSITCSFGVAAWRPGITIDQLLKRADIALYEAKRRGRNVVVCADKTDAAQDQPGWNSIIRPAERTASEEGTVVELVAST